MRHSILTEYVYVHWVRAFTCFHWPRQRTTLGGGEIEALVVRAAKSRPLVVAGLHTASTGAFEHGMPESKTGRGVPGWEPGKRLSMRLAD